MAKGIEDRARRRALANRLGWRLAEVDAAALSAGLHRLCDTQGVSFETIALEKRLIEERDAAREKRATEGMVPLFTEREDGSYGYPANDEGDV
jgi:hypothetical protein